MTESHRSTAFPQPTLPSFRSELVQGEHAEVSVRDEFLEHRQRFYDVFTEMRAKHPDMPIEDLRRRVVMKIMKSEPKSRAFRRIQATRRMAGAKMKNKNLKDLDVLASAVTSTTLVDASGHGHDQQPLLKSSAEEATVM